MTSIEEKHKQNNDVGHKPSSVPASCDENGTETNLKSGTPLTQRRSGPVRYELIDKDGNLVNTAGSAAFLAEQAGRLFPDQEQDPDRTGKGWDVQEAS